MKYRGQGKKECLIMRFCEYEKQWNVYSKPCTMKTASILLQGKNKDFYRIDTIKKEDL